jgi:uncharacterized protein (TIGR02284 family)
MAEERSVERPGHGGEDPARAAAVEAERADVPTVNELILVAREGAEFYASARENVANPRLRELFEQMIAARARLVDDLSLHVAATGSRPVEPTAFGVRLRRLYADLLAHVADDTDRAYVMQLEEVEDGLLQAFEDAVAEVRAPALRKVLEFHLPRVRDSHDRIRAMKHALH